MVQVVTYFALMQISRLLNVSGYLYFYAGKENILWNTSIKKSQFYYCFQHWLPEGRRKVYVISKLKFFLVVEKLGYFPILENCWYLSTGKKTLLLSKETDENVIYKKKKTPKKPKDIKNTNYMICALTVTNRLHSECTGRQTSLYTD